MEATDHKMESDVGYRILSMDGGGTRGVVIIEFLKQIEEIIKPVKLHEYFHMIGGTSTGAIIAFGIGALKLTAHECEKFYDESSQIIFRNKIDAAVNKLFVGELGDHVSFKGLLQEKFNGLRLEDIENPKIFSVASSAENKTPSPFIFRTYKLPPDGHQYPGSSTLTVFDAIRSSSAAPLYLKPHKIEGVYYQDGGLVANNPSLIALTEAKYLWPTKKLECLISLGTGAVSPSTSNGKKLEKKPIFDIIPRLMSEATSANKTHVQVLQYLNDEDIEKYKRIQVTLNKIVALDETNPIELANLKQIACEYMKKQIGKVENLLKPKS